MNKTLRILAFLIILMALTVPTREDHIHQIEDRFNQELQQKLDPKTGVQMIGVGIASMLGGGVLKALLKVANYNHYVVLSIMTIPSKSKKGRNVLSIGVLGQVLVMSDLEKKEH